MSRRLGLGLLGATALLWALWLLRVTPAASPPLAGGMHNGPITVQPEPNKPAAVPAQTREPNKAAQSLKPQSSTAAQQDAYREALVRAAAEQRKRNEARLVVALQRWPREQRQEPWASQHEAELRSALERDQIDGLIGSLQCRATLCRIELQAQDSNAGIAVSEARNFQQAVGPQNALSMRGGGFDRSAILFAAREGQSLDP
ncbi:MAG: hypothetical protein ACHQ53_09965 [Polyangiales bacterium]